MSDVEKTVRTRVVRTILRHLIRTGERLNIAAISRLADNELKANVCLGSHFKYNNKKRRGWASNILDRLQVYRRIKQCLNSLTPPTTCQEADQLRSIMAAITEGDESFVQPIAKMIRDYFKDDGSYKNGYSGGVFNQLTFTTLAGLLPTKWITSPLASVVLQTMVHSHNNQAITAVTNSGLEGLFAVLRNNDKTDLLDDPLWANSPTCIVFSGCQQFHWLGAIVWEDPNTPT